MAIIRSRQVDLRQSVNAWHANVVQFFRYEHTFDVDVTTADILELGILPARLNVVGAKMVGSGLTNVVDIGVMSGDVKSDDAGRTVGDELFDGVAIAGSFTEADNMDIPGIPWSELHRSIGLKPATDITAGAKTIWLDVFFAG